MWSGDPAVPASRTLPTEVLRVDLGHPQSCSNDPPINAVG
jgi:hypothetical protein